MVLSEKFATFRDDTLHDRCPSEWVSSRFGRRVAGRSQALLRGRADLTTDSEGTRILAKIQTKLSRLNETNSFGPIKCLARWSDRERMAVKRAPERALISTLARAYQASSSTPSFRSCRLGSQPWQIWWVFLTLWWRRVTTRAAIAITMSATATSPNVAATAGENTLLIP